MRGRGEGLGERGEGWGEREVVRGRGVREG